MSTQVRYKEIYRALMRDIAEGVFSGGEKLPTEQALAERFGVTRQTLLKALNIMKLEGTLRSEQGRGTFVNAPAAPRPASGLRQLVYIASNLQEFLAHRALVGAESIVHRHDFSHVTCFSAFLLPCCCCGTSWRQERSPRSAIPAAKCRMMSL